MFRKTQQLLITIISFMIIGAFFGIINFFAFADYYNSLVPGGMYGTLHGSDFSSVPLLGMQSGEQIVVQCYSNRPVTVGIVGNLSNSPPPLKDYHVYKNGTSISFSWVVNQTRDYYVTIFPIEAGDTYFSLTAGKESARKFPDTLIITEVIGAGISMVLFYLWYKFLVVEERWKGILFGGK